MVYQLDSKSHVRKHANRRHVTLVYATLTLGRRGNTCAIVPGTFRTNPSVSSVKNIGIRKIATDTVSLQAHWNAMETPIAYSAMDTEPVQRKEIVFVKATTLENSVKSYATGAEVTGRAK